VEFGYASHELSSHPLKGGESVGAWCRAGSRFNPGGLTTAYGFVRAELLAACALTSDALVTVVECMAAIGQHGVKGACGVPATRGVTLLAWAPTT